MDPNIVFEAGQTARGRLHQDLVDHTFTAPSKNLQLAYLREARGLEPDGMGPKSIDELKSEQMKLQKWSAKFAGANKALKDEVVMLREEIQRAYESDPLRSGKFVSRDAYDLLKSEHEQLQKHFSHVKSQTQAVSEQMSSLRTATTKANEEKDLSMVHAASAAEQVHSLKQQISDIQRVARQKQGALEDMGVRLAEIQNRYDILAHHTLQLGEEKTSLVEALRERQSQLDFALAQLQMQSGDQRMIEWYKKRIADLEKELQTLKTENADLRKHIGELKVQPVSVGGSIKVSGNGNGPYQGGVKMGLEDLSKASKTEGREGTVVIKSSMKAASVEEPVKQLVKHRGLVIRVRWHPTTGKHTFGTRFLQIDTDTGVFGWSKEQDSPVSTVIPLNDIKRLMYGYASNMTGYKRNYESPHGTKTPSSGSANEDILTPPISGPSRGLLSSASKISLPCCFTILTKEGRSYDFFTLKESECYGWMKALSTALKPYGCEGTMDSYQYHAASGWTRIIEQCCARQITTRRLLIEGMEKAGTFALTTGMGKGGGTRKPRIAHTRATKAGKSGVNAGLSYKKVDLRNDGTNWEQQKKQMKANLNLLKNVPKKPPPTISVA